MATDPTLWRVDSQKAFELGLDLMVDALTEDGVLVPVEPVGTAEVYTINAKQNIEFGTQRGLGYEVPDGVYMLVPLGVPDGD